MECNNINWNKSKESKSIMNKVTQNLIRKTAMAAPAYEDLPQL